MNSQLRVVWHPEVDYDECIDGFKELARSLDFPDSEAGRKREHNFIVNNVRKLSKHLAKRCEREGMELTYITVNICTEEQYDTDSDSDDGYSDDYESRMGKQQLKNLVLQQKSFAALKRDLYHRDTVLDNIVNKMDDIEVCDHPFRHIKYQEDKSVEIEKLMAYLDTWCCSPHTPPKSRRIERLVDFLNDNLLDFMFQPSANYLKNRQRSMKQRLDIHGAVGTVHTIHTKDHRQIVPTLMIKDKICLTAISGQRKKSAFYQISRKEQEVPVDGKFAASSKFALRHPSLLVKTNNLDMHKENKLSVYWLRRLLRKSETADDKKVYNAFIAIYNMTMMTLDDVI